MQKGEFHLVADIGCGSGLSSRILSLEGYPWVGIDVSLDMLALAQTQDQEENNKTGLQKVGSNNKNAFRISQASLCQGHLTASDMSQGLPFRTEAFDFAISISAVQWLCYTKTFPPRQAAQRFFDSVWRCLRTSESRAAFQVYLESKYY
jgi:18S rRNA (guanine1575-N7)-methyltransferase